MPKLKTVLLVASGDLRASANEVCWPAQRQMEAALSAAVAKLGWRIQRAHPFKPAAKHGFIGTQKEGMEVFARIDPDAISGTRSKMDSADPGQVRACRRRRLRHLLRESLVARPRADRCE